MSPVAEQVWFAPGRANLMGEHTDYNGGFVLPFALAQGVTATAAARDDGLLALRSAQLPGEPVTVPVDSLAPGSVTGWAAYPAGVAWALREAGYPPRGATVSVDSDLPVGAGVSSSAALECSVALALCSAVRHRGAAPRPGRDRPAGGERVRRRADRHHRPVGGAAVHRGPRAAARLRHAGGGPGAVPSRPGRRGRHGDRHAGAARAGVRRVRVQAGRVRRGRPAARRALPRRGHRPPGGGRAGRPGAAPPGPARRHRQRPGPDDGRRPGRRG